MKSFDLDISAAEAQKVAEMTCSVHPTVCEKCWNVRFIILDQGDKKGNEKHQEDMIMV